MPVNQDQSLPLCSLPCVNPEPDSKATEAESQGCKRWRGSGGLCSRGGWREGQPQPLSPCGTRSFGWVKAQVVFLYKIQISAT